jgi:hypothetical protein
VVLGGGEILLNQVGWDNLRKIELGSPHSQLGGALLAFPALFTPLSWGSLVLDLGAPLALLHRRLGRAWAVGAWGFHLGIAAMMWIVFPYPFVGVAYASFFDCEKVIEAVRRRLPDRPLWTKGLRSGPPEAPLPPK